MPRQRMRPGEWGKITVTRRADGKYVATTYTRDDDGRRREVERSGISAEDASRNLKRHLTARTTPITGGDVTERTTLSELFELWITRKERDGLSPQSVSAYRRVWALHGQQQIGALRVRELPTSRAERHLHAIDAKSAARRMRGILTGMFAHAARSDVITINPLRETSTHTTKAKPARSVTPDEFARARAAVIAYRDREGVSGPTPGRLLPAFIDLMVTTGCRPNEVLAMRWAEIDLDTDPPTATVTGTLIDHRTIAGRPLHRQDKRKGGAPPHTVVLPRRAVTTLAELGNDSERRPDQPVFATRAGGWVSLANLRRALRAALPDDLRWITPYSFRRTVATVIRDAYGIESAQQQLSHAKLTTTEQHYAERRTRGPDARDALDTFTGQPESTGKVRDSPPNRTPSKVR